MCKNQDRIQADRLSNNMTWSIVNLIANPATRCFVTVINSNHGFVKCVNPRQ